MPDPRRVLAQHSQTARLLGVDFMPVGSRPAAAERTPAVEVHAERAPAVLERMTPPAPASSSGPSPSAGRTPEEAQRALDELCARYEADAPHAAFITEFTNIVFGEGHPRARLMFVGEAPGAEEDRTGRPFVGRAGQLLDKMIAAMGLSRGEVYIANVLKTRPPGNATPTSEEARLCAPYLFEQIRIVAPEAIVTLGLPATRTLLDTAEAMGQLRGRWATLSLPASETSPAHSAPVMPTYHPAFLLRSYTSENRAKVWSDLQQVMDRLGLAPARG